MIQQHFISEETERLALTKGLSPYVVGPNFWNPAQKNKPCWYQATIQQWLREVHTIDVWVEPTWEGRKNEKILYIAFYEGPSPWSKEEEEEISDDSYCTTYEEALEDGLKAALTLIP